MARRLGWIFGAACVLALACGKMPEKAAAPAHPRSRRPPRRPRSPGIEGRGEGDLRGALRALSRRERRA